ASSPGMPQAFSAAATQFRARSGFRNVPAPSQVIGQSVDDVEVDLDIAADGIGVGAGLMRSFNELARGRPFDARQAHPDRGGEAEAAFVPGAEADFGVNLHAFEPDAAATCNVLERTG